MDKTTKILAFTATTFILFLLISLFSFDFSGAKSKLHKKEMLKEKVHEVKEVVPEVKAKEEQATKEVSQEVTVHVEKAPQVQTQEKETIVKVQAQEKTVKIISKKVSIQKNTQQKFTRKANLISDNNTGLIWQDNQAVKITMKPYITNESFQAEDFNNTKGDTAFSYCENLTIDKNNDFRLPSIDELSNIMSKNVFENLASYNYWSSSANNENQKDAWYIYAYDLSKNLHPKSYSLYVRCVRSGK